jgi:hypothetical protein
MKKAAKNYLPGLIFLAVIALFVFIPASGPLEFLNKILIGLENIFTLALLTDPRAQVGLVRFLLFIVCSIMFGTAANKVDALKNLKDGAKYTLAIVLGLIAAIGLPEPAILAVANAYSTIFFTLLTLGVAVWAAYTAFEKFKPTFWKHLVGLIILIATTIFLHLIYSVMSNASFSSETLPALVTAIYWVIRVFYGLIIWKLLLMLGLFKKKKDNKDKEEIEDKKNNKRLPLICVKGKESNKQKPEQNSPNPFTEHAFFTIKEWDDESNYPTNIPMDFKILIKVFKDGDDTPIDESALNALDCIVRIRGTGITGSSDRTIHVNETNGNHVEFTRKKSLKIREIDCSKVESYIRNNMPKGRYFIHIGLLEGKNYYDSSLVIIENTKVESKPETEPETNNILPLICVEGKENHKTSLTPNNPPGFTNNHGHFLIHNCDNSHRSNFPENIPKEFTLSIKIYNKHGEYTNPSLATAKWKIHDGGTHELALKDTRNYPLIKIKDITQIDCGGIVNHIKSNTAPCGNYHIIIKLNDGRTEYDAARINFRKTPLHLHAPIISLKKTKRYLHSSNYHKTGEIIFSIIDANKKDQHLYSPIPSKLFVGIYLAIENKKDTRNVSTPSSSPVNWGILSKAQKKPRQEFPYGQHAPTNFEIAPLRKLRFICLRTSGRFPYFSLREFLTKYKIYHHAVVVYAVLIRPNAHGGIDNSELDAQLNLMISDPDKLRYNAENNPGARVIYDFDSIKVDPKDILKEHIKKYLKIKHEAKQIQHNEATHISLATTYWKKNNVLDHLKTIQKHIGTFRDLLNHDFKLLSATDKRTFEPILDLINQFLNNLQPLNLKASGWIKNIHNKLINGFSKKEIENINAFLKPSRPKEDFHKNDIGPADIYDFILMMDEKIPHYK